MPKVSVIIPVYNVEAYLKQCLDSVINQTLKDIEIILVDDESPDNCPKICDDYAKKDKRIKVIHQKNKGLSGARNTGMEFATGEYIAFIDSDDWIEKTMLRTLFSTAEKHNSDVAVCNVNLCYPSGKVENKKYWRYEKISQLYTEDIYSEFLISPCWSCNKIYKKNILDKLNLKFIENILYEDVPFFTELFLNIQKISFVPEYFYNYRLERDGAITVKPSVKQLDISKVRDIVSEILKNNKASKIIYENFNDWTFWNYIWMYKHLPKSSKYLGIRKIKELPSPLRKNILLYLEENRKCIYILGIPVLFIKFKPSCTNVRLFNIIPIISIKKKKR